MSRPTPTRSSAMHLATRPVAAGTAPTNGSRRRARLWRALAAAVIVPLALGSAAACWSDEPTDANAPIELSMFFWGGEARAKLTEDALKLYHEKHPNITIKTTWQANQGYFDKLATLTAGNDAPDIYQI